MNLQDIYKNVLVKHYREQHGATLKEPFIFESVKVSPTCGDEINLRIHDSSDKCCDISYEISGCTVSQSSSSIMYDLCQGKTIPEVMELYRQVVDFMNDKTSTAPESLGDVSAFDEVRRYQGRIRCVLLSWEALIVSLQSLEKK